MGDLMTWCEEARRNQHAMSSFQANDPQKPFIAWANQIGAMSDQAEKRSVPEVGVDVAETNRQSRPALRADGCIMWGTIGALPLSLFHPRVLLNEGNREPNQSSQENTCRFFCVSKFASIVCNSEIA